MTLYDLLWKIVETYPVFAFVFSFMAFVISCLAGWWIKKNMITVDGMKLALSEFKESLRDEFVSRGECEAMLTSKQNGRAFGAAAHD